MELADLNRDGKVDIAFQRNQLAKVIVCLGIGGGEFGAPTVYTVGGTVRALRVADVN